MSWLLGWLCAAHKKGCWIVVQWLSWRKMESQGMHSAGVRCPRSSPFIVSGTVGVRAMRRASGGITWSNGGSGLPKSINIPSRPAKIPWDSMRCQIIPTRYSKVKRAVVTSVTKIKVHKVWSNKYARTHEGSKKKHDKCDNANNWNNIVEKSGGVHVHTQRKQYQHGEWYCCIGILCRLQLLQVLVANVYRFLERGFLALLKGTAR